MSVKSLVVATVVCLLLGIPAFAGLDIVWVSDAHTPAADAAGGKNVHPDLVADETPWDQGWVDLLTAAGHNVTYPKNTPGSGPFRGDLTEDEKATLNAAHLVIVSRDTSSGSYNRRDDWNSITAPLIQMSAYLVRSNRWKWLDTSSLAGNGDAPLLDLMPAGGGPATVPALDPTVGTGNTSFILIQDGGAGEVLARVDSTYPDAAGGGIDGLAGSIWVAQWMPGVEFYDGSGQTGAHVRMLLTAGTREGTDIDGIYWGQGMYNLTPAAQQLFADVVNDIPEPATLALLGLGGLALLRRRSA